MHYTMEKAKLSFLLKGIFLLIAFCFALPVSSQKAKDQKTILIQEQGSFAVGGIVITTPGAFNTLAKN